MSDDVLTRERLTVPLLCNLAGVAGPVEQDQQNPAARVASASVPVGAGAVQGASAWVIRSAFSCIIPR